MSSAVHTIGAYGWQREDFHRRLREHEVDLFLDLRQRRGLRGSRYAWANAGRLTADLERCSITYRHVKELAPTTETRAKQHAADAAAGMTKSARQTLGDAFVSDYRQRTLDRYDFTSLLKDLEQHRAAVLFCVEAIPAACHRSLVAERVESLTGAEVIHLVP